MPDWVIGVDLGGTKIEVGLVNPLNEIVGRRKMPTQAIEGPAEVVERIAGCVEELKALLPPGERLAALGICSPGPVDHETGTLIDPPNLAGLHNAPLRQLLSERLNLPVRLEHDAKATALGEFYYGAGQGEQSMVYIIVGTGVGGAIIENGQLLRGKYNSAGEIGHVSLDRNGELCSCGSRGCVETFLSGPWLARRYEWALTKQNGGQTSVEPVTGERVAALAAQGDLLAKRVLTDAGESLGIAVAAMAMLFNIDLFVVGGSVAKSGDLLLEPARRMIPRHSYRSVGCAVQLLATEIGEDGPILGCAWLARQALLEARAAPPSITIARSSAINAEIAQLEKVSGLVFDVQRFSVQDGPGIRTNVFLKGCPLRCDWCANPESQRLHTELALSASRCIRCGQFSDACPDAWGTGETQAEREKYGERVARCPAGGIHWLGERRTAGEIIADVLSDRPFYDNGGGLTLTGGEPTFQPRFAEALLRLARFYGLTTVLETSGHTRWSVFERLLPYLDLILYDIKHLDGHLHRQHTGVDNDLILANLKKLAGSGAPVTVRVPLIPGFNADEHSLQAISTWMVQTEGLAKSVTLLPYHTLGRSKYQALGREYIWAEAPPTEAQVQHFAQIMAAGGLRVTVGG